jgi:hypothetical protein
MITITGMFVLGSAVGLLSWGLIGCVVAILDARFDNYSWTGEYGHIDTSNCCLTVVLWPIPVIGWTLILVCSIPRRFAASIDYIASLL